MKVSRVVNKQRRHAIDENNERGNRKRNWESRDVRGSPKQVAKTTVR
jgi:hypothetical protein